MSERYAYHVFAHSEGRYQTVHAVGVSSDEVRQLEQFFFGQTADPKYLESLSAEPGVIWRYIGSRISLTRVTQGDRDANDRSTLRFESLLANPTNTALRSHVEELCIAKWQFSADGAEVTARQPTSSGTVNAGRISEVLLAVRDGSHVVVSADELTLNDASRIIRHAVDIPNFSLCYKSLNKQAPVSINIVALAVSENIKVKSKHNPAPISRQLSRPPAQRAATRSGTSIILAVILVAFVLQTAVLLMLARSTSVETDTTNMRDDIIKRVERLREDSKKQFEELNKTALESRKRYEGRIGKIVGQLADISRNTGGLNSKVNANQKALATTRKGIKNLNREISKIKSDVKSAQVDLESKIENRNKSLENKIDAHEEKLAQLLNQVQNMNDNLTKYIKEASEERKPQ